VRVKLLQDGQHFRLVDARGRCVGDVNEFLRSLRTRGLSPHTVRAYAYDLRSFFSWLISPGKVRSLETADLCKFIDQQRESNLSPRSINRRLTTAQLFYRFVTGKDFPATIGCSNFRARSRDRNLGIHRLSRRNSVHLRVKVPKKLITPLTNDQVKLLLRQFARYRDLALCYLMVLCGLRAQEVLNIQCKDLRPFEKTLYVHGKGNKERLLPLPEVIWSLIAKYLALERPTDCITKALFVVLQGRRRGWPMTVAGVRSLFRVRRQHPQLANIHPHLLRHTFGSAMAASGMSLPTLQRMMGHAFPETTMQYINLSMNDVVEQFQQAAQKIAKHYS
jgi:site-specific recombinase XerD